VLIAKRVLTIQDGAVDKSVPIRIYAPEFDGGWRCRYEIGWPDGAWTSAAGGVDAVQALHLALQKIGTEIYFSEHHRSGALRWIEPGQGYGFPVPKDARDILIGEDQRFEG
jgi:hypothetical protein